MLVGSQGRRLFSDRCSLVVMSSASASSSSVLPGGPPPPGQPGGGTPDTSASSPQRRTRRRRRLQRLVGVPGSHPERVNDLLLVWPGSGCGSASSDPEEEEEEEEDQDGGGGGGGSGSHVVFFPGDIQNFEDEMAEQKDASQWLCWSLERTALALGRRFPGRYVWVVRASLMYLHKFSCYQNFVASNMFGAPEHSAYSPDCGAFQHLRALLSHGMDRARLPNPLPPPGGAGGAAIPSDFSLTLVGFSKGCVVLNQMAYELGGARRDPALAPFVGRVADMFWLDGGHPGGSETWVTDRRALKALAASGVGVHAHVTPYEVCDPMRAWVGREHRHFVQTLEDLGASVDKRLHFEDEPASIDNHFRVILEF